MGRYIPHTPQWRPGRATGAGRSARPRRGSADAEEVDHEDERLAGLDGARAAVAVAEVRRDDQLATAADLHARDTLVPAPDDAAGAQRELEGLATVPGRVELL